MLHLENLRKLSLDPGSGGGGIASGGIAAFQNFLRESSSCFAFVLRFTFYVLRFKFCVLRFAFSKNDSFIMQNDLMRN
jgi:hypothetical protein